MNFPHTMPTLSSIKKAPKKVAIIADWLTNRGGAERVIEALAEAYPEAPVYTLVYTQKHFPKLKGRLKGTFLQKLPQRLRTKHQFLLHLYPIAFESLDLSEYDIIISSSSSMAKSVKKTRADQIHICYCHSPIRYIYHAKKDYVRNYPLPLWAQPIKLVLPLVLKYIKYKDQQAVKRVDHFISNSNYIAKRIKKYYHRDATTIYPCIDTKPFLASKKTPPKEPYFFAIGRFIPYKNFDQIVQAFTKLPYKVKLGGIGPDLEKCKRIAKEANATNIEFLGFVPDEALPGLYANARAFLFPGEEDFGLTPVESMASGTPVIHYNMGGVTESVPDLAGIHYTPQTADGLIFAIESFIKKENNFDSQAIKTHAKQFDQTRFIKEIKTFVDQKTAQ
jgi:glycosyltransferase involved in cell wall biosynthesis